MSEARQPGREDEIIAAINDHKGHILAVQAFAIAVFRALPVEAQARALVEWDTEIEVAKTTLLNSSAPDDLVAAVERYADALNQLRSFPPTR